MRCMSLRDMQISKYEKKNLGPPPPTPGDAPGRVWNISNITHNLLPYIYNCYPIEVIFEKRCIKFVWSLFNSNYALYSNILRLSLQNDNLTMGENVQIACINMAL